MMKASITLMRYLISLRGNSCPRTILQCLNVAEPKPRWTKSTSECDTAKTNVEKSASKCDTTPNQGGKKKQRLNVTQPKPGWKNKSTSKCDTAKTEVGEKQRLIVTQPKPQKEEIIYGT